MTKLNPDLPVWVYRNLRTGNFSLMQRGKVVDHRDSLLLEDCRFVVRPAGYARYLRERRKNVHAFVVGTLLDSGVPQFYAERLHTEQRLSYNPAKAGHFCDENGNAITNAQLVAINKRTGICAVGAN